MVGICPQGLHAAAGGHGLWGIMKSSWESQGFSDLIDHHWNFFTDFYNLYH